MHSNLSPSYQIYKCHWENCPAELHNLDTLRKHVHKQHRERLGQGPPYPCRWADCWEHDSDAGRRKPADDDGDADGADGQRQRLSFMDAGAWDAHVEDAHLVGYKWRPVPELAGDHRSESRDRRTSGRGGELGSQETFDESALAKTKKGIGGMGIYASGSDIVNDKKRDILARGSARQ